VKVTVEICGEHGEETCWKVFQFTLKIAMTLQKNCKSPKEGEFDICWFADPACEKDVFDGEHLQRRKGDRR